MAIDNAQALRYTDDTQRHGDRSSIRQSSGLWLQRLWVQAPSVTPNSQYPTYDSLCVIGRRALKHAFIDRLNWQFQIELLKLDCLARGKAFLLPAH